MAEGARPGSLPHRGSRTLRKSCFHVDVKSRQLFCLTSNLPRVLILAQLHPQLGAQLAMNGWSRVHEVAGVEESLARCAV
eukprot:462727-Pelagomonas_calceolata.AAC.1